MGELSVCVCVCVCRLFNVDEHDEQADDEQNQRPLEHHEDAVTDPGGWGG